MPGLFRARSLDDAGFDMGTQTVLTTMEHYAGIDVSLESASVCVVDASGRIVGEAKVASEPEVLIGGYAQKLVTG